MKKIFITIVLFINFVIVAQTYIDKPFIQDYADKFELNSKQGNIELLHVKSDRNNRISILSSTGLVQPWEGNLVSDLLYRPLIDMNIISIDRYENQFVYLTDKAVLSNAWAGKFYFEHGMLNPKQFSIAHDFVTLIAGKNELKLFKDGKAVWEKSLKDFTPLKIIFDKKHKRFLILSDDALYLLKCPKKKLNRIFKGKELTSFAIKENNIKIGTNNGVVTIDGESFKVSGIDKKLPWTEITVIENIN